jgi:hypothetical protein
MPGHDEKVGGKRKFPSKMGGTNNRTVGFGMISAALCIALAAGREYELDPPSEFEKDALLAALRAGPKALIVHTLKQSGVDVVGCCEDAVAAAAAVPRAAAALAPGGSYVGSLGGAAVADGAVGAPGTDGERDDDWGGDANTAPLGPSRPLIPSPTSVAAVTSSASRQSMQRAPVAEVMGRMVEEEGEDGSGAGDRLMTQFPSATTPHLSAAAAAAARKEEEMRVRMTVAAAHSMCVTNASFEAALAEPRRKCSQCSVPSPTNRPVVLCTCLSSCGECLCMTHDRDRHGSVRCKGRYALLERFGCRSLIKLVDDEFPALPLVDAAAAQDDIVDASFDVQTSDAGAGANTGLVGVVDARPPSPAGPAVGSGSLTDVGGSRSDLSAPPPHSPPPTDALEPPQSPPSDAEGDDAAHCDLEEGTISPPFVIAKPCRCGSYNARTHTLSSLPVVTVFGRDVEYRVGTITSVQCRDCSLVRSSFDAGVTWSSALFPLSDTRGRVSHFIETSFLESLYLRAETSFKGVAVEDQARAIEGFNSRRPDMPMLRTALKIYGEWRSTGVPFLQGITVPCLACAGSGAKVMYMDGNSKCFCFTHKSVATHECSGPLDVLMGTDTVARIWKDFAAVRVAARDSKASDSSKRSLYCGETQWAAAAIASRLNRKKAIAGTMNLVCRHRAAHVIAPLSGAEDQLSHLVMLLEAVSRGTKVLFLDCACQFIRWLGGRIKANSGFADPIVAILFPGTERVELTIVDSTTVNISSTPVHDAAPGARCLPDAASVTFVIPSMHMPAHDTRCQSIYSADVSPGAGAAAEVAEHQNAMMSATASLGHNMNTASYYAHTSTHVARCNYRINRELPETLASALVKALVNRAKACVEFGNAVSAAETAAEEGIASAAAAARAAAEAHGARATRAAAATNAGNAARAALDAEADAVAPHLTVDDLTNRVAERRRVAVMAMSDSASSLRKKVVKKVKAFWANERARVRREDVAAPSNDEVFVAHLDHLHGLLRDLRALLVEEGSRKIDRQNADDVRTRLASTRKKIGHAYLNVQTSLLSVSSSDLKSFHLPLFRDLQVNTKRDILPWIVGPYVFDRNGLGNSLADDKLVDAFCARRRARRSWVMSLMILGTQMHTCAPL